MSKYPVKASSGVRIGVLIPTRGDRPQLLAQAMKLLKAQTLQPTEICVYDPKPKSKSSDLAYRYYYGLRHLFNLGVDLVICWEDDDWYSPQYIEYIVSEWERNGKPDLIGIKNTTYYNITNQKYTLVNTRKTASMMCTAVTEKALAIIDPSSTSIYLDQLIWTKMKGILLTPEKIMCVGIKHGQGVCGGCGHDPKWSGYDNQDEGFKYLSELIGATTFYSELIQKSKYEFKLIQHSANPFLSIITRVMKDKRPEAYGAHKESIKRLESKDFEELMIIDSVGYGVHEANRSLSEAIGRVSGDYVYLLDDDNFLLNPKMIDSLKKVSKKHNPDVIIFRAYIRNGKYDDIYPTSHVWRKEIKACHIGGICFAVKREIFDKFIYYYDQPSMGDFHFIDAVIKSGASVYWLDEFQAETFRVGRGKAE